MAPAPCPCRLCQPTGEALDDHGRKLLDDVQRYGWHVVGIPAEDGLPGWCFTVGLTHSMGTPEVAIFGLSTEVMANSLNTLGDLAREGNPLRAGNRVGGVLEGFDVELRAGEPAWNEALFGYARWFYQSTEPAFLQCIWPDMAGRFPWEPAFEDRLHRFQPALWVPPAGAPAGPWRAWWYESRWPGRGRTNGLVFATRRVASGERPVLSVEACDDGDWVFLDGGPAEASDMTFSHVHHLLQDDPTLEETIDLQPGMSAWREAPGAPWTVG